MCGRAPSDDHGGTTTRRPWRLPTGPVLPRHDEQAAALLEPVRPRARRSPRETRVERVARTRRPAHGRRSTGAASSSGPTKTRQRRDGDQAGTPKPSLGAPGPAKCGGAVGSCAVSDGAEKVDSSEPDDPPGATSRLRPPPTLSTKGRRPSPPAHLSPSHTYWTSKVKVKYKPLTTLSNLPNFGCQLFHWQWFGTDRSAGEWTMASCGAGHASRRAATDFGATCEFPQGSYANTLIRIRPTESRARRTIPPVAGLWPCVG